MEDHYFLNLNLNWNSFSPKGTTFSKKISRFFLYIYFSTNKCAW